MRLACPVGLLDAQPPSLVRFVFTDAIGWLLASSRDQGVVDVVVEADEERFSTPRSKIVADLANPLGRHPAAGVRRDIDCLVQQVNARDGIAESQPSQCEVRADDAALDRIARLVELGNGFFKPIVRTARVTGVQRAQALESVESVRTEAWVRIVGSELIERFPGSLQCDVGLLGLTGARADFGVYGVCAGSDRVARTLVGSSHGGSGDVAGRVQVVRGMQGDHGVAGVHGRAALWVGQLRGRFSGFSIERGRGTVVVCFEGESSRERERVCGDFRPLMARV